MYINLEKEVNITGKGQEEIEKNRTKLVKTIKKQEFEVFNEIDEKFFCAF